MANQNNYDGKVIFQEMLFDLYYRLMLAEEDFLKIGDAWQSATVFGDCAERMQAVSGINAFAKSLRIIENDLRILTDGETAVFPAELGDWMLEAPDMDQQVERQLERLLCIMHALKRTVRQKMMQVEEKNNG